jgi:hypothetical protein
VALSFVLVTTLGQPSGLWICLSVEWANRGINMWTIEEGQIDMVTGQATYDLPVDTVDLLAQVIRTNSGNATNQTDLTITRISVITYSDIPNKLITGRPIQVWVDRQSGATEPGGVNAPKIYVWPTPDEPGSQYKFVYWRMRRIQDAGTGVSTQDIPFRWLNCLIAGLAYYLSMKLPRAADRVQMLKAQYEEQWKLASEEDREKAAISADPKEAVHWLMPLLLAKTPSPSAIGVDSSTSSKNFRP